MPSPFESEGGDLCTGKITGTMNGKTLLSLNSSLFIFFFLNEQVNICDVCLVPPSAVI